MKGRTMTPTELKHLLERAGDAVAEYSSAIDGHLYRLGSCYGAEKEQETRNLAYELHQAAERIET